MGDDSGCGQLRADIDNRRQDLARFKYPGELVRIIDAVLERENARSLRDQWFDLLSGGFGVVGFDAKQNEIDGANFRRIVGEQNALFTFKSPLGLVT